MTRDYPEQPTGHAHDPSTFVPLDGELTEDDDMDDAEREAMLHDECVGNYGEWRR